MSQNSDVTDASDSNILYMLNTNDDSNTDDNSDSSIPDLEDDDDYKMYDQMEQDSAEERSDSSDASEDIDLNNLDTDVEANDHDDNEWSKRHCFEPDMLVFEQEFKLKNDIHLPRHPTPFDFFNLFLTREIVEYVVQQSNLYATQKNFKQEPMNNLDFYRLIGFLFYSSLCKLPCKSDYWSTLFGPEIVMKNITRDRINELLRSLHFANNIFQSQSVDKIQPLIELFNSQCHSVVEQEQNVSIDEQMVGYKGKSAPKHYKQYLPKKPKKRGFKLWSLSGVSGFTYTIKLYCGAGERQIAKQQKTPRHTTTSLASDTRLQHRINDKNTRLIKQHHDAKQFGEPGMVVIDLLQNVPKGSHVFVDNYFGSLSLLNEFNSRGYGLTCTLRSNRIKNCSIKSQKTMKNHPRGFLDYVVSKDKKVIIVAWNDSKCVTMGSNVVGINPIIQLSRWSKEQNKRINIDAPKIVRVYNKNMGGVDKVDMLCALHPIPFRSKKWYIRIVWRILDLMVINAWVLWKHMSNSNSNWRQNRLFYFKMAIAKMMLSQPKSCEYRMLKELTTQCQSSESYDDNDDANDFSPAKKRKRETASNISGVIRFDGIEHWPQIQQNLRLRCKNDGCTLKTNVYCSKCQVHLCLNASRNCFTNYHCKN